MVEYEDFKKDTLYQLARNGGTRYEENVRKKFERLDSLDYHLHLRQLQDDGLLERHRTKASSPLDILVFVASPRESQAYLELTDSGWDWVRQSRLSDSIPDENAPEPPPDPD